MLTEARTEAPASTRLGGDERAAVAITALTLLAVAADAPSWVRLPLALAFVVWVPGTAVAAWLPGLARAERRGAIVAAGMATSILVSTVAAWAHWWHPALLAVLLAASSMVSLRLAPARPVEPAGALPVRPVLLASAVAAVAVVGALGQLAGADHVVGEWGLLPSLPLLWFAAVVAIGVAGYLSLRSWSSSGMATTSVLLVVLLHGTSAVAYAAPRFPWTYKHLGVVDSLLAHGRFSSGVDIYHNWPGFFAGAGEVLGLGGTTEPMALLRWWPALIGLAGIAVLRLFLGALTDDRRVIWGAIALFVVANWFGQDYFAPQSVAFLLAFATFGLLLRTDRAPSTAVVVVSLGLFAAITVSHQLTPYLVLPGLVVAAAVGGLRPRWVVAACAAMALAYLAPRYGFVQDHGGLGRSSVADNVRTPSAWLTGEAFSVTVGTWASRLLTAGLALLAVPFLLRLRSDRRRFLLLAGNIVGPACVLVLSAYGSEGLLRVALFTTPWLAFAAASSLASRPDRAALWSGALLVGTGLFAVATIGLDTRYRVGPDEVALVRTFEATAPEGALLAQLGPSHLPVRLTARYPLVEYVVAAPLPDGADVDDVLDDLEEAAEDTAERRPVYVSTTAEADVLADVFGYAAGHRYAELREALRRSSRWELVLDTGDALLARYRG